MLPEAELIKIITRILYELGVDDYTIKFNYRQNLESLLERSGIDKSNFKSVCTTIDKLDKLPWDVVKKELYEKELTTDKITIMKSLLDSNYCSDECIELTNTLISYLKSMNNDLSKLKFDCYLARGLDYYTGMIFEVIINEPKLDIGTVIAGGRYDKLIYKTKKKKKHFINALGISFGVSRLQFFVQNIYPSKPKILIVTTNDFFHMKLTIAEKIRSFGWCVKYIDSKKRVDSQINYGIKNNFNYVIIYGEDGIGKIKVKKNDKSKDVIVNLGDFETYLSKLKID